MSETSLQEVHVHMCVHRRDGVPVGGWDTMSMRVFVWGVGKHAS
jgi:hypothetical protein